MLINGWNYTVDNTCWGAKTNSNRFENINVDGNHVFENKWSLHGSYHGSKTYIRAIVFFTSARRSTMWRMSNVADDFVEFALNLSSLLELPT